MIRHLKTCCYGTSNARCYTAPFTKLVATRQYFTKSQNHFHKAQIITWQLFSLSLNINLALFSQTSNNNLATISKIPNTNLALFYKTQILFWQLFHKAQKLIWQLSLHYLIKPKYEFGTILQSANNNLATIFLKPKL